ncbi:DUF802 domain-containing protein [Paraburkholderia phenoliruptrix]|uniref:DUF802 domain-containing protein n=1 Tax=Paraburkholderia phenoliruptrix TaxID=252970 RepID=UPI001C6DE50F|nr:DUF802 domain-containing protein [Paraburkholderia phenoliruptrix]MBW9102846.1 DUF802 domain-containing protein [Paraburkholderia phenoliruptrix]MBW9131364.1 DUF802 domain-containing protein [Paraburkholderia ginsengiterrae]
MSRYRIDLVVFAAGLAAVCGIAVGYVGSNWLALAVTLLIGAFYLAGALELRCYGAATATLARALDGLSEPPPRLDAWLAQLHPSLRNAAQLRIEGERVALPGPALTPYLVGLLVLLGMLGTLLGMVVTLRGTGLALDSATDLAAIRASLAAPVKGLGFAFGTSIAGVASSAMLGLLSALCRRDRLEAAQRLDATSASTLRVYSQAHQREESLRLLQRQAELMPTLVDRLQTMMAAMEQHSLAFNERQLASQEAFHSKAQVAYARLAASVEQSLKQSVADSTRAAGEALEPVMQATMAGLARESAALQANVSQAVQRQLDGLSSGFESATAKVAGIWNEALAGQQRSNEEMTRQLRASLESFAQTFDERSGALVSGVSARLEAAAGQVSEAWKAALAQQQQTGETMAARHEQALAAAAATFEQHSASLLRTVGESHAQMQTVMASRDEERLAAWSAKLDTMVATLGKEWQQAGEQNEARLAAWTAKLDALATSLGEKWQQSGEQNEARLAAWTAKLDSLATRLGDTWQKTGEHNEARLAAWTAKLDALATSLGEKWQQSGEQNEASLAAWTAELDSLSTTLGQTLQQSGEQNEARLAAWTAKLDALAATLGDQWQQAGERTASRQQQICDTFEQTARDISAQTQAHASATIAEIAGLVQAASEAPKAAAEVVAELRQKLSDSMVRDTAMLQERSRLLETLETLLDAVNHASTEQRAAVDALVATSADLLERVGTRFTEKVEAEADRIGTIAAQITGGAVEVASLGEAFGAAVQSFGESNDKLVAHLERIEAALDKSLARSDEQLAYYVAQAREVVDLSVMSQKQIVEDLQQLAARRTVDGVEAA